MMIFMLNSQWVLYLIMLHDVIQQWIYIELLQTMQGKWESGTRLRRNTSWRTSFSRLVDRSRTSLGLATVSASLLSEKAGRSKFYLSRDYKRLTLKPPEPSVIGYIAYSDKLSGGLRVKISLEYLENLILIFAFSYLYMSYSFCPILFSFFSCFRFCHLASINWICHTFSIMWMLWKKPVVILYLSHIYRNLSWTWGHC